MVYWLAEAVLAEVIRRDETNRNNYFHVVTLATHPGITFEGDLAGTRRLLLRRPPIDPGR